MKARFKEAFSGTIGLLLRYNAVMLAGFVLARVIDYGVLASLTSLPAGSWYYELGGVLDDLCALSYISLVVFIPVLLLFLIHSSLGKWFLRILFVLVLFIHFILVGYFASTFILLDHALYKYTFSDIAYILDVSGISLKIAVPLLLLMLVFLGFLFARSERLQISRKLRIIFLPLALFFTLAHDLLINLSVNGDLCMSMKVNKVFFFLDRSLSYLNKKDPDLLSGNELKNAVMEYRHFHPGKTYTDEKYPLMAKNEQNDVLGTYFNVDRTKPPRFVFIICEGLAHAFCGPDASDASFTPFLDSLSYHSLYFPNFLSTAERTTNVLPSVFGSLPYAREGFTKADEGGHFPKHLSLISLLKENGYFTSFHYSGWTHFTNYDGFMYNEGIDYITSNWSSKYKIADADDKKFSWGYSDGDLYSKSLEDLDSLHPAGPTLDIYLTLSTHHPFHVPDQAAYLEKVKMRMNDLKLPEEKKQTLSRSLENYASVMYADDAMRQLFEKLRKRPGFENTIFFICGDHAMPETELRKGYLACYHIPLFIYSPMLKNGKKIKAVSSHLDIAPSLTAFLMKNFEMKMPEQIHWLGEGLDTSSSYRNMHDLAFIHNNSEVTDYLSKDVFLTGNTAYDISDSLWNGKPLNDVKILEEMKKKLSNFQSISRYVCSADRIWDPKQDAGPKNANITLPARTVFDLSSGADTIVTVVENYKLDTSMETMNILYSFEFLGRQQKSRTPPAMLFRILNNDKQVLYTGRSAFDMSGQTKTMETEWIPVEGFSSIELAGIKKEKGLYLQVLILNRDHLSFNMNDFRISARTGSR